MGGFLLSPPSYPGILACSAGALPLRLAVSAILMYGVVRSGFSPTDKASFAGFPCNSRERFLC